jgi:hypothetical protein
MRVVSKYVEVFVLSFLASQLLLQELDDAPLAAGVADLVERSVGFGVLQGKQLVQLSNEG